MNLGRGIRVMLARRNISQTRLAREVGVSRPYMSSLCTNNKTPSFGLLESISLSLGCEMWEIIKESAE
jgi:DNA-binding Xre family transcriptional regulator